MRSIDCGMGVSVSWEFDKHGKLRDEIKNSLVKSKEIPEKMKKVSKNLSKGQQQLDLKRCGVV